MNCRKNKIFDNDSQSIHDYTFNEVAAQKTFKKIDTKFYYSAIRREYDDGYKTEEKLIERLRKTLPQLFYFSSKSSAYFGYIAALLNVDSITVEMTVPNTTLYYQNSARKNQKYWASNVELFARAFETYIANKLEVLNRENNYLVSYNTESNVYPKGMEKDILFTLFDSLMQSIKSDYDIGDFVPFTQKRADEYIVYDNQTNKVATGVIAVKKQASPIITSLATVIIRNR